MIDKLIEKRDELPKGPARIELPGDDISGDSRAAEENVEEDKYVKRMKAALNSMLDSLTVRINSTEVDLGAKLKLLDLDMDGEVSVLELKTAIARILKRAPTDKEAEELASLLDKDRDGRVSVAELTRFVEERREMAEFIEEKPEEKRKKPSETSNSTSEMKANS